MGTSETHWMVILGGKQVTRGERRGGRPSGDTRFHQHMTDRGSCKSQMFSGGENKQVLLYPNKGVETQKQAVSSAGLFSSQWKGGDTASTTAAAAHFSNEPFKGTRPGMHRQNTQPRSPRAGCGGLLGPYRVLFRRNNSLMSGCVKCTRPLLEMLVTRSRWSRMCRSMLKASSSGGSGGELPCVRRRACGGGSCRQSSDAAGSPSERTATTAPRPGLPTRVDKHLRRASELLLLHIQMKQGPASPTTRPLFLKVQEDAI